ncbi:hypothetical protein GGR56DRAFT_149163 [Xylariaceae sp. FL0804]|nr:hypothetical protein GGR56DRAFT_149163 [Xylariaceae sp. FL0804]
MVMTSRNPSVGQKWLESMEALDAKRCDRKKSGEFGIEDHYGHHAPIAGVAQGAIVLQATMFADTTLETVDAILGPKVQGSIHLDELFHVAPLG